MGGYTRLLPVEEHYLMTRSQFKDTPVKPNPKVESVIETTSGTQNAYYATLDITVKNDGAEGTFLVVASVTQNGKTSRNEWPVYLKQGKSYEMKMTFPLTWKGGKWESNVQTVVP